MILNDKCYQIDLEVSVSMLVLNYQIRLRDRYWNVLFVLVLMPLEFNPQLRNPANLKIMLLVMFCCKF